MGILQPGYSHDIGWIWDGYGIKYREYGDSEPKALFYTPLYGEGLYYNRAA